jgi:hypothetical protein
MCSARHVVDSISRPIIYAQFQDALTDASAVAWISHLHATDPAGNAGDGVGIPEAAQPVRKFIRLTHLDHKHDSSP